MSAPALFTVTVILAITSVTWAVVPTNVIKVASVETLGTQTNTYPDGQPYNPQLARDVGVQGQIGNDYYEIYADTSILHPGYFPYFQSNSIAALTSDPTVVSDFNDPPTAFCSNNDNNKYHLGPMVPFNDNQSVGYYINLTLSPPCNPHSYDGCAVNGGAYIATANASGGQPLCELMPAIFDAADEPLFGATAVLGPYFGWLYMYGQLNASAPGGMTDQYVYAARVPPGEAADKSAYQFWNGSQYQSKPLTDPDFFGYSEAAISNLANFSLGSAFYSEYYNCYVVLTAKGGNSVVAYTAPAIEGPYSQPLTIWYDSYYTDETEDAKYVLYLPQALPYFDKSGKTLVVDLSEGQWNNVNVTLKFTFE